MTWVLRKVDLLCIAFLRCYPSLTHPTLQLGRCAFPCAQELLPALPNALTALTAHSPADSCLNSRSFQSHSVATFLLRGGYRSGFIRCCISGSGTSLTSSCSSGRTAWSSAGCRQEAHEAIYQQHAPKSALACSASLVSRTSWLPDAPMLCGCIHKHISQQADRHEVSWQSCCCLFGRMQRRMGVRHRTMSVTAASEADLPGCPGQTALLEAR